MKNFLVYVLVLGSLIALTLFPTTGNSLAKLPDEGGLLIMSLLTAGVGWVLLQLGTALGVDLKGYIQPVTVVLAPILITVIENYLNLIPSIYDNVVTTVIHLIVLIVGMVGWNFLFKRAARPKSVLE